MYRALALTILGLCLGIASPAYAQFGKPAGRGKLPFGKLPPGSMRTVSPERFQLLTSLRRVHENRENPQELVVFLDDEEAEVRRYAIDLLVGHGADAYDPLFEAARDGNPRVRSMAVWTLRRIGPKQLPALYPLLVELRHDFDHQIRLNVCALFAWTDARSVYPLIEALEDDNALVRSAAADSLGYFKSESEEAVPFLADLLKDPSVEVRRSSALAIGRIGSWGADFARSKLIEALADRDATVRTRAAAALGKVTEEGMPELIAGLGDPRESVRNGCATALIAVGSRSVPSLVEKLRDTNPQVRFWAAYALGRIGKPAESAVPLLTTLATEDQDSQVRYYANTALSMIRR